MASSDYNDMFKSLPSKTLILRFSDGTVLTNDKIVKESLELEDNLCSDINLKYGGCESGNFRIRIVNEGVSFKDLWVDVYIFVKQNNGVLITNQNKKLISSQNQHFAVSEGVNVKLGRYKVWSDKPTGDRVYRDLDCYDQMKDIVNVNVASWYSALTFPMTLKNFRDSLFDYLGVQQETVTLINDNYSIKGGYIANELSSRDMLLGVCELNGVFGHINRDGKFDYISLPSSDTVEIAWYPNGASSYEDYETDKITKVSCYPTDSDAPSEVGTDGNTYFLDNNLLFYGDEGSAAQTTALTNLLNAIKDFTYRPFSVRTYGNPMMDLGTSIIINTTNQTINSFVMNRYLKGIHAMMDEYSSYGDMTYPEEVNRVKTQIQRTAGKTAQISTELNDIEAKVVLKVDNNGKIVEAELSAEPSGSAFKILADNIDFIADDVLTLAAKNIGIQATNFKIDKATGLMECKGGSIGGFTIDTTKLYNGMTTLSDTTHDGVYVGTDGIALGKGKFKVTNAGALTATSGNIGGITINGTNGILASSTNGAVAIYPTGMIYITNSAETKTINLSNGTITANYGTSSTTISGGGIKIVDAGGADFYLQGPSSGARINFEVSGSGSYAKFSNLSVTGTKSRVVETEDYGDRLMYCYETPTPMFGDIGEGIIAEDGKCYIWLDPVFAQTINSNGYQVFLQKYGKGECYVTERKSNYFVVEGDAGLSFGWELKAKQSDYEMKRLDRFTEQPSISNDYGNDAIEHIKEIQQEREVV